MSVVVQVWLDKMNGWYLYSRDGYNCFVFLFLALNMIRSKGCVKTVYTSPWLPFSPT
jgi:hypothetical protein